MRMGYIGVAMVLVIGTAGVAHGQSSASAAPAEKLVRQLKEKKMQHVASADPQDKDRFVAAMLIGDSQIFLVSAKYAQPILMNERLLKGDYQGAYIQLNSASIRQGKLFVQDLGTPGLHPTRESDKPFDIVYRSGTKRTVFDGDWKGQRLSKDKYMSAFEADDKEYAAALEALLGALDRPAAGAAATTRPPSQP